jgi:hypothetical protein
MSQDVRGYLVPHSARSFWRRCKAGESILGIGWTWAGVALRSGVPFKGLEESRQHHDDGLLGFSVWLSAQISDCNDTLLRIGFVRVARELETGLDLGLVTLNSTGGAAV